MAKKERNLIETAPQAQELGVEEETLLEAEAYTSPQPDSGSDVTVLKPVGTGGPVPIVSPKHNTIQLQPIIVPLAVVPYMTQDSSVLRTDGKTAQPSYGYDEGEAAQFKAVEKEKEDKKPRMGARLFAFISLLLAALTTVPFILSYFDISFGSVDFAEFNTIKLIASWINKTAVFSFKPIWNILGLVVMAMAMLSVLLTLIGLIIGKYPKPLLCIFEFVAMGCLIAELVLVLVNEKFEVKDRIIFIVVLALTVIAFVLSVIFSATINRREDKAEEKESEI